MREKKAENRKKGSRNIIENKKNLKSFLVQRFLLILLAVAVGELLLSGIYSEWLMPYIQKHLDWEIFGVNDMPGGTMFQLFAVTIWFLIQGIMTMMPSIVRVPLREFLVRYCQDSYSIDIQRYFPIQDKNLWIIYYFLCLLLILILLTILLIPYFVGATLYSRQVDYQVQQIIENEKEQRRKFEEKRSLMLSDIAHDLKTPMTTVDGYAQALSQHMVPPEQQQKYLDAISRKSSQMNHLLGLLFEYVKLDSQGFVLQLERLDITELLRECAANIYMDLEKKRMELQIEIPDKPVYFLIDKIQFTRGISNLLMNSLRHNESGTTIIVKMFKIGYSENWSIMIADNGTKIPREIAEHLFEPFAMGDESRSKKEGSGLGMTIAYKIMQKHGWDLYLDNSPTEEYVKAFKISLNNNDGLS